MLCGHFLKSVSTKSRGNSNATKNTEAMLIQTNSCDVIDHPQLMLFHALGHKKACERLIVLQATLNSSCLAFNVNMR